MRYEHVDRAVTDGKLWRAKEILEGRLGATDFDRELLMRYGKVLLAMGDLVAAGRALFFSGNRDAEAREAIDIFLSRHPRTEPKRFISGMPAMIRRQTHLAEYLASDEFERSGWSEEALKSIKPKTVRVTQERREPASPLKRRLQDIAGAAVALTFVILLFAGMISVGRFVFSSFR